MKSIEETINENNTVTGKYKEFTPPDDNQHALAKSESDYEDVIQQLRTKERELNNRITAINKSNASIEFDLNGNILSVNDLFLDLLGYSADEVLGKHHSLFLEPGYAEHPTYLEFWKNLRLGLFQQDEFMRIRKDGQSVWLRGNYNPIFDEHGKPERVLKIATDITLTKKQQIEIDAITTAIAKSNLTIELNLDGRIIKANDSFLELVGYKLDEVIGKHHSMFVDEADKQSDDYVAFWNNLRSGEYQTGEYKRVTREGQIVWIKGNYNPIFDSQGRPYKVIKIASDITNSKKQQIEIDAITMAIYKSSLAIEFDMQGNILNANTIFENIMGYRADEIIGKHHSILIDPAHSDNDDYNQFWANLRAGEYQEGEFMRVTRSGDTAWIKGNYNPIFDTQGMPYKVLKIATDVTLAHRQAEELSQQAIELQKQQHELSNVNMELEQYAENLKTQHERLQIINDELGQQKTALEVSNREIQEANYLIEQKTAQIEISSKYKSEFLANMSHELRTPLNSLLILSQDLATNRLNNLTEEQVESAGVIYKSGNDLLHLINEVLDLSKIEAGKMTLNIQKAELDALAKSIYLDFRHQAERKHLAFQVDLHKDLPRYINTDPQRLEQVLRNIIGNAIKFTDQGEVRVSFKPHGNYVSIEVRDTGIGIPMSQQASVFEAFQQADGGTSRKYGGTGLGLSISRDLTKLLEGEISLKSDKGEGSTFTITIPRAIKESPQDIITDSIFHNVPEPVHPEDDDVPMTLPDHDQKISTTASDKNDVLRDRKILLVDDDMRNVFALSRILRNYGINVLKADDGEVALELLRNNPDIDIILMDIMMPVMDGFEAITKIRQQLRFRNLPIFALTAKAMNEDRQKCIDAGANEYVSKPINVDLLLQLMCKYVSPLNS